MDYPKTTSSREELLKKRILTTVAIPGGQLRYDGERTFATAEEAEAAHPGGVLDTGRSHEEYRPTIAFRDETDGSGKPFLIAVYGWRTDAPWDGKTTYVPRLICEVVPGDDGKTPKIVSGTNAPGFYLGGYEKPSANFCVDAPKVSSPIHAAVARWAVRRAGVGDYSPAVSLGRDLLDLGEGHSGYIGDAIASHMAPKGVLLWTDGETNSFRNEDGTAIGAAIEGIPLEKRCAASAKWLSMDAAPDVGFPDFSWLKGEVLALVKPGETVPKVVMAVQGGKAYRLLFWAARSADGSSEAFMTLRESLKGASLSRERSEFWGTVERHGSPYDKADCARRAADREPLWIPIKGRDAARVAFRDSKNDLSADLWAVDGKTVGKEEAVRAMKVLPKAESPEDEALFDTVIGFAGGVREYKALRAIMRKPFLKVLALAGYFQRAESYVAAEAKDPKGTPGQIARNAWRNWWGGLAERFNPDGRTVAEVLGIPERVWSVLREAKLDGSIGFEGDYAAVLEDWGLDPETCGEAEMKAAFRLRDIYCFHLTKSDDGKEEWLPAGQESDWLPRLEALFDGAKETDSSWDCSAYVGNVLRYRSRMTPEERGRFPLWFDPKALGKGTDEPMATYLQRSIVEWRRGRKDLD